MRHYIILLVIIVFIMSSNIVISEEIFNISISPDGTKAVVYKQLGIDVINLNTQEIISFIPAIPLPKWGDKMVGFLSKVLFHSTTRDKKTHDRNYTTADLP